jgi:hypothetical protein
MALERIYRMMTHLWTLDDKEEEKEEEKEGKESVTSDDRTKGGTHVCKLQDNYKTTTRQDKTRQDRQGNYKTRQDNYKTTTRQLQDNYKARQLQDNYKTTTRQDNYKTRQLQVQRLESD